MTWRPSYFCEVSRHRRRACHNAKRLGMWDTENSREKQRGSHAPLTNAEQARRAAALAAAKAARLLEHVTNEVIPSIARTVDGARLEIKLSVFRLQAHDLMSYVRKGVFDQQRAVDALQEIAESNGLVERYGQDEIQAIMSEAALGPPPNAAVSIIVDKPAPTTAPKRKLISQLVSSVALEKVTWLWPGRIAVGKLTLIGGKPGIGKSQLASFIAAAVSRGLPWPCNEGQAPYGNVIIFSAEDGVADTIAPRLIGAGADPSRITVVSGVESANGRKTFDLKADIDLLETRVREIGNVALIIVDPVSAYMGGADGHGNVETRGVLEPIAEMADRLRIAVLAITHLNKAGASHQGILERFQGSIAFIAAARAGFAVIADEKSEGRALFLQVKNNLAPMQKGLAFRCLQRIVGDDIVASIIDWENEYVTQTADEALTATEQRSGANSGTAKEQAVEFLLSILATGPMPVREIDREAVAAGLHEDGKPIGQNKPLRDARKALGVVATKAGFGAAGWVWALPAAPLVPSAPIDAHSQERASMDREGTYAVSEGDHG